MLDWIAASWAVVSLFSGVPAARAPLARAEPGGVGASARDGAALARCLAAACLANERLIHTLQYRSTLVFVSGPHPQRRESVEWLDERGRWRSEVTVHTFDGAQGAYAVSKRAILAFDGEQMTTADHGRRSGLVREYQGEMYTWMAVDHAMGWRLDRAGHVRIGELLLDAKDLTLSGYSADGRPILVATVVLRPLVAQIEVELDPERGFAPCRIVVRDRALRVAYDRYVVERMVQLDGVWLPAQIYKESFSFSPGPDDGARLGRAIAEAGLSRESDMFDPAVQAAFGACVRAVFGTDEAPGTPMATPLRVTYEYTAVNAPIPDSVFRYVHPEDYVAFDGFLDTIKDKGSAEWRLQHPPGDVPPGPRPDLRR